MLFPGRQDFFLVAKTGIELSSGVGELLPGFDQSIHSSASLRMSSMIDVVMRLGVRSAPRDPLFGLLLPRLVSQEFRGAITPRARNARKSVVSLRMLAKIAVR